MALRTLLIDNYDSYTYNLFQLIAEVNGGAPGRGGLPGRRAGLLPFWRIGWVSQHVIHSHSLPAPLSPMLPPHSPAHGSAQR